MSALPCCVLVLLLFVPILTEAKRQPGQEKPDKPRQPPPSPQPAKRPRNRSVPGSGELTTKEGHRCVWQTSGEGLVSLLVNCSIEAQGDLQRWIINPLNIHTGALLLFQTTQCLFPLKETKSCEHTTVEKGKKFLHSLLKWEWKALQVIH